jgi:site-specific DNA recombinase
VYVDKLDGLVDAAFFDKMSNQWREEQNRCQREIDRHQSAEQSYMDEGVQILELARNAWRLFELQEPRQKLRLLNFVLSNCTHLTDRSFHCVHAIRSAIDRQRS